MLKAKLNSENSNVEGTYVEFKFSVQIFVWNNVHFTKLWIHVTIWIGNSDNGRLPIRFPFSLCVLFKLFANLFRQF